MHGCVIDDSTNFSGLFAGKIVVSLFSQRWADRTYNRFVGDTEQWLTLQDCALGFRQVALFLKTGDSKATDRKSKPNFGPFHTCKNQERHGQNDISHFVKFNVGPNIWYTFDGESQFGWNLGVVSHLGSIRTWICNNSVASELVLHLHTEVQQASELPMFELIFSARPPGGRGGRFLTPSQTEVDRLQEICDRTLC